MRPVKRMLPWNAEFMLSFQERNLLFFRGTRDSLRSDTKIEPAVIRDLGQENQKGEKANTHN